METFYYGDPRNEIDKSKKTISRLWSFIVILMVIIVSTTIIYFVINHQSSKILKKVDLVNKKTDTTNTILMSQTSEISKIQNSQNETNIKVDSLIDDINYILYMYGKGSKMMNRIEKKTDTIILLINK